MTAGTSDAGFVQRSNDRALPDGYDGDVLIWDIDKTYLDTRFSSLRGLLAIPFELAIDKRAVPGTVPLLRALRHGAAEASALVPLYFVSGSPKQLRRVVEKKMTLDGVQFDGITFKDQWALLRARRPRAIVEQIGYKLKALLLYRRELPRGAQFLLFGDDVERDTEAFLTFGEICAGLRGGALQQRLAALGAWPDDVDEVVTLADAVPPVAHDPVARVFIHEVRGGRGGGEPQPRVVRAPSFLVHALVLCQMGRVRAADVDKVADEVRAAGVDVARLLPIARGYGVDEALLRRYQGDAAAVGGAGAGS